ncbi:hypothetical protein JCM15754A_04630 [Prevotella aurantiaca JCM 15754]
MLKARRWKANARKAKLTNATKQGKANCKSEGAKCDKQKMAMHSEHAKEMMAKHSAYLEGLKKILTDSQYQQLLNM